MLACVLLLPAWAQAAVYRFALPYPDFPVRSVFVTDPAGQPYVAGISTAEGVLTIELDPPIRLVVHLLCPAGRAGTLMLAADNQRVGYLPGERSYNLLEELLYSATGKRETGLAAEAMLTRLGHEVLRREAHVLQQARAAIRDRKGTSHRVRITLDGQPVAGQEVRFEQETVIPLLGFGASFYEKSEHRRHTRALFDYVVLPFYLPSLCPERGIYNWEPREASARWCRENGLETKGHPLVWFFDAHKPDWLAAMSYPELKAYVHDHIVKNVAHFRGLIDRWDVINEAHGWANSLKLSNEQQIEITEIAVRAAKEANPTCQIVVNCCLPWGDYTQSLKDPNCLTPLEYYRELLRRRCPFDVIGLQLYNAYAAPFPHRDLTAMSELIDRFGRLGKEIHITEFSTPSAGGEFGAWHGSEWTPDSQARYAAGLYEVACAKPFVKSINWWFVTDVPGTDWVHLGLVTAEHQPKPVLNRLIDLKRSWLSSGSARTDQDGWLEFHGLGGRYRFRWENPAGEQHAMQAQIDEPF
ncbi:MAG: hypothetical protein AMXMBFR13_25790 [Phycisphaerae bacterium]